MSKPSDQIVKVWPSGQIPQALRRVSGYKSEWVALIPASLLKPELEALFLRWDSDQRPVVRHTLADGSIVFSRDAG